jgi:hypothetical protein
MRGRAAKLDVLTGAAANKHEGRSQDRPLIQPLP